MKVAIIMPLAEQRGGAELALKHLVEHGKHGQIHWQVIFLEDGPMVAEIRALGAETVVIPAGRLRHVGRTLGAVRMIASWLRAHKAEAVLGWMSKAQLYGSPAAKLTGIPAFWFQLGLPSINPHWMDRLAMLFPAQGILACSHASAEAQSRIWPRRPTRVIHLGVDLTRFDGAAPCAPHEIRKRLGLPEKGPLIGIVGRLQRWKGIHVFVEAMHLLRKEHPDVHAVIVGGEHALEPDYPARLVNQIRELGLEDCVKMVGLQQNVPEWMQAMDVVVHASEDEPFGLVVIEAMALRKPLVATDTAGPSEIITNGKDGLLTPYGRADLLAKQIGRLIEDPGFAAEIANAAQERASRFSASAYANRVVSALEEMTAGFHPN